MVAEIVDLHRYREARSRRTGSLDNPARVAILWSRIVDAQSHGQLDAMRGEILIVGRTLLDFERDDLEALLAQRRRELGEHKSLARLA
ncbi:hypothetical protein KK137_06410 [Croceibacterium sp. LX-88]|uniref:Uncharacterized protein n=1 Tax=Croceibacterium selenioxidans TaxID=2838833 RepID=A0ABS5W4F5_9SPHN|nr:hypothetical protein [Croceibacterium selenioxidans]MBT2133962.1 hypothetical protein [Croceibacterium selenioxidans]